MVPGPLSRLDLYLQTISRERERGGIERAAEGLPSFPPFSLSLFLAVIAARDPPLVSNKKGERVEKEVRKRGDP